MDKIYNTDVYKIFVKKLSINFRKDYANLETVDGLLALMIFEQCKNSKMDINEFYKRLDMFLIRQKYDIFKISDFFELTKDCNITRTNLQNNNLEFLINDRLIKTDAEIKRDIENFRKMINSKNKVDKNVY